MLKVMKAKRKKQEKFEDLAECHKENKNPAVKAAMPKGVLKKR